MAEFEKQLSKDIELSLEDFLMKYPEINIAGTYFNNSKIATKENKKKRFIAFDHYEDYDTFQSKIAEENIDPDDFINNVGHGFTPKEAIKDYFYNLGGIKL